MPTEKSREINRAILNDELRERCKAYAEEVEAAAAGRLYKDASTGETYTANAPRNEDDEQVSLYDWIADAYDISYEISGDLTLLHGSVMVAGGGPTIWVSDRSVEGSWWSDKVYIPLDEDAGRELFDAFSELYNAARGC